jgi:hypothetical protein
MLSTAMFEAAHARIFDPLFTSCKIISTTVVVFPVPGGPCSKNTFFDDSAFEMASFLTPRKKKKRKDKEKENKQNIFFSLLNSMKYNQ